MSFIEKRFFAPARRMKELQFAELSPPAGSIVFLGDSITAGGAWHEWFPDLPVINRGIDADTTDGVVGRLDSALHQPSKVFLLIGTNDVAFRRPLAGVQSNQKKIVERVTATGAQLYIQGVLPRKNVKRYGEPIRRINQHYGELATEFGANYLDLAPVFGDGRGELRTEFTLDGLHLNGRAYRAWVNAIREHVES